MTSYCDQLQAMLRNGEISPENALKTARKYLNDLSRLPEGDVVAIREAIGEAVALIDELQQQIQSEI